MNLMHLEVWEFCIIIYEFVILCFSMCRRIVYNMNKWLLLIRMYVVKCPQQNKAGMVHSLTLITK